MKLHFADPQVAVLVLFGAIALALVSLFVVVALQSRKDVPYEAVQQVGYRLRRGWFVFLAALLVVVVGTSLFFLPYAGGDADTTTVRVSGGQFYWSTAPNEVEAGTHVRFEVTSIDVNHGFGLYHPDGKLIGSVQAMPGFTNDLDLTLEDPGTYRIACLEFCGFRHDKMFADFEVLKR